MIRICPNKEKVSAHNDPNISEINPRRAALHDRISHEFLQKRFATPPDQRSVNRASITESGMSDHKFKIGQSVQYTSGPYGRGTASAIYKITYLLPTDGGDRQYRIKSA